PAPVSPVTTLKPGDRSSTASSITPRPWIRTSSTIGRTGVTTLRKQIPDRRLWRLSLPTAGRSPVRSAGVAVRNDAQLRVVDDAADRRSVPDLRVRQRRGRPGRLADPPAPARHGQPE